jgi:hypothetical protein
MKMRIRFAFGLAVVLVLVGYGLTQAPQAKKVDNSKILGTWEVTVDAGQSTYHLTMELKETAGKLEGALTESSGTFKDLPLAEITFDGATLTFQFSSPTPPDGLSRLVNAEFKLVEGILDGLMKVAELEVSVPAKATRQETKKS